MNEDIVKSSVRHRINVQYFHWTLTNDMGDEVHVQLYHHQTTHWGASTLFYFINNENGHRPDYRLVYIQLR